MGLLIFFLCVVWPLFQLARDTSTSDLSWSELRGDRPNFLFSKPSSWPPTSNPASSGVTPSGAMMYFGEPWYTRASATSFAIRAAAFLAIVAWIMSGAIDGIHAWTANHLVLAWFVAVPLFLWSFALGVLRHVNVRLLREAVAMTLARDDGVQFLSFIGDVADFRWHYSGWHRARSWILVALAAVVSSALISGALAPAMEVASPLIFFVLLAFRWTLSAAAARFL